MSAPNPVVTLMALVKSNVSQNRAKRHEWWVGREEKDENGEEIKAGETELKQLKR